MSNMDSVTKSFATSLAIATNDVVDISSMAEGGAQRNSQSYLLARPLTLKLTNVEDLKRHFRRIWVLNKGFNVQQRSPDRFLFSFDLRGDRNKVLMVGPWNFNRALVVIQPYDGVSSLRYVEMEDLFFWVRIINMPPAYEQRNTIANVATVAGKFIELDQKFFDATGEIRVVRVSHAISKPFFMQKTLKFAKGIEQEVHFFFRNLMGKCKTCQRMYHEGEAWKGETATPSVTATPSPAARKLELNGSFLGFSGDQFKDGMFHFQGLTTPILPPVGRSLFGGAETSKVRKPIVIHSAKKRQATDGNELALVPVDPYLQAKRDRSFPSPKKLQFFMSDFLEGKTSLIAPSKKVKMPEFPTKFSEKSLGLVETPGGMLVPVEVMMPKPVQIELPGGKKKRGRPLGANNKNPPKAKKVPAEDVLSVLFLGKPPNPSLKGKEKI